MVEGGRGHRGMSTGSCVDGVKVVEGLGGERLGHVQYRMPKRTYNVESHGPIQC